MSLRTKNCIQFVKPLRHSWHIHFKTYTRVILLSFKIIPHFFSSRIPPPPNIPTEHARVRSRVHEVFPDLEMGFRLIYRAGDVDGENEITRVNGARSGGWGRKKKIPRRRETCAGYHRIVFRSRRKRTDFNLICSGFDWHFHKWNNGNKLRPHRVKIRVHDTNALKNAYKSITLCYENSKRHSGWLPTCWVAGPMYTEFTVLSADQVTRYHVFT